MSRNRNRKKSAIAANKSDNQAFEDDLNQGQDEATNEGVEVTDPYDIREFRYRHKDGRYYYDRRPTDASGSVDVALDYDATWKAGDHSYRYVRERDRVLRAASRAQTSDAGEKERKQVVDEKTFPHYFKNLTAKFDPNAKPPFKKESPHEREGRIYLTRHKIMELFHNVTTLMLVERPPNPKQFLISHLTALMAVRESYPPNFDFRKSPTDTNEFTSAAEIDAVVSEADARLPVVFNEDNIRATLSMMDPTGKTIMTRKTFRHALQVLGFPTEEADGGGDDDKIEEETFVSTMRRLATDQAKTFYPRVMLEKKKTPTFEDVFIQ